MSKGTIAVLGASNKRERYANQAQRLLVSRGYKVIPVHPAQKEIEGMAVVNTLAGINEEVDTVTVYLNPATLNGVMGDLLRLHPRRVIFNPGTESLQLAERLKESGIEVEEACTLVLLQTGQF